MKSFIQSSKHVCLLGGIVMKIGVGVIGCWGNINMYYFSTFYQQGYPITSTTNSITMLSVVLAMIFTLCCTPYLGDRFGYVNLTRICAGVFLLAPQVPTFMFGLYSFISLCLVVPVCCFGVSTISIVKCVWEFYPHSRNMVTAVLAVAYGVGVFGWNFVFMHVLNPQNEQPSIKGQSLTFFSEKVSNNVLSYNHFIFLLSGVIFFGGSFLIRKQDSISLQVTEIQHTQKVPQLPEEDEESRLSPVSGGEFRLTNRGEYWMAVRDIRFMLLLVICLLFYLYEIYLVMYVKIIYQFVIKDDHFLSYCVIVSNVVGIGMAFFWGWLADSRGFQLTTLIICVLDFLTKIYSWWAVDQGTVLGLFVLVGLVSKSLGIVVGPAYVEMFGLEIGTNLLPFKAVALTLGFLIVPLMQIMTNSFLSPLSYLHVLSTLSLVSFALSIILYFLPALK